MINILKKITGNKKEILKQVQDNRGETLAETIIALAILTIGITLASTMMASSMRNMHSSKNRVIAVNIAREGIEAVRNIRDTNWLKFSSHRRDCWNHLPIAKGTNPNVDADICTANGADLIQPRANIDPKNPTNFKLPSNADSEAYIIYLDKWHRWRLKDWVADSTVTAPFDNADVYLIDIDKDNDTDDFGDNNGTDPAEIKHDKENDRDMYNHLLHDANPDSLGGSLNTHQTNFKRIITIDYLTNNGDLISEPAVPITLDSQHNRMVVTSIVSWNQGKVRHKVELKTHLTDYYGREKLEH